MFDLQWGVRFSAPIQASPKEIPVKWIPSLLPGGRAAVAFH